MKSEKCRFDALRLLKAVSLSKGKICHAIRWDPCLVFGLVQCGGAEIPKKSSEFLPPMIW